MEYRNIEMTWGALAVSVIAMALFLPGYRAAETNQPAKSANEIPLKASLGLNDNWVWIPAGSFLMGSPKTEKGWSDKEGLVTVAITHGFFMGKHEVTQGEYLAVIGNNPSFYTDNINLPVERVSYWDAMKYCETLTANERRLKRLPDGWHYRLPTEAEWEYACRAGGRTAFHYGDELRSGMANFDGRYEHSANTGTITNQNGVFLDHTTPVGTYKPNAWGLYDMHGNVSEWVYDRFRGQRFLNNEHVNPLGTDDKELLSATRGGNYKEGGRQLRCAQLSDGRADYRISYFGFRVVLSRTCVSSP